MVSATQRAKSAAKRGVLAAAPPLRRVVEQRDEAKRQVRRWRRKAKTLQTRIDELSAEVARVQVGDVQGSSADDLDFVFIVTYGRSGSTLLQGILTSIPGYDIKGENRAALYQLFKYHRQLEANRANFDERKAVLDQRHPFYGADQYATDAAFEYMRAMVVNTLLRPPPGTRVTGFKEIRWGQKDWQEFIPFLQRLFPGAKFIVNTRNAEDVIKSRWWAEHPDPMDKLAKREAQHDEIERFLGDQAYHVHFDDYVADHNVLRGLFDWLGEEFDPETIDKVMNTKHSIGEGPEHLRKDKN